MSFSSPYFLITSVNMTSYEQVIFYKFSLQENDILKLKSPEIQFVPSSSYIMLRVNEFKLIL